MYPLEMFFSLEHFAHRSLWETGDLPWAPLHRLTDYFKARSSFRIEIPIPEGVHLVHPEWIAIGEGTLLEPGVMIQGPCVLGKNCIVRHGAYLREQVLCGDRCVIGHCAEIKHSILLDGAHATHFVYVGDSILGNEVNLGAGVKCANLRLDRKEIVIQCEGQKISTGLRKMGALIGDRSQIGCNCVCNPGTCLGKDSTAYPLLHLSGWIAAGSHIKKSKES